jgi:hypothetical protein
MTLIVTMMANSWHKAVAHFGAEPATGSTGAMHLKRLDDDHQTSSHRGIEFWMSDENGGLVFCRVSHEALQDHANRNHITAADNEIFEAFRELIEQVASDAFDAEIGVDEAGCVVVTKEALDRVGRSA